MFAFLNFVTLTPQVHSDKLWEALERRRVFNSFQKGEAEQRLAEIDTDMAYTQVCNVDLTLILALTLTLTLTLTVNPGEHQHAAVRTDRGNRGP